MLHNVRDGEAGGIQLSAVELGHVVLGVKRVVPAPVTGLDMEVYGIIQKVESFVRLLRGRGDIRGCLYRVSLLRRGGQFKVRLAHIPQGERPGLQPSHYTLTLGCGPCKNQLVGGQLVILLPVRLDRAAVNRTASAENRFNFTDEGGVPLIAQFLQPVTEVGGNGQLGTLSGILQNVAEAGKRTVQHGGQQGLRHVLFLPQFGIVGQGKQMGLLQLRQIAAQVGDKLLRGVGQLRRWRGPLLGQPIQPFQHGLGGHQAVMFHKIGQRAANAVKIAGLHFRRKVGYGLLSGVQREGTLQNPRLMELVHVVVQVGGKLLQRIGSGLLRLGGEVNAPLLANLGKVPVDGTDKAADGLGDGLQAGFQLRQRLVSAPSGDIAHGIGAGVDAVILADGEGHALGLHLHGAFVLGLGWVLVCVPGSGGEAVLLPVMEDRVADLMDSGAHRLYLAHALPDGDGLLGEAAHTVRIGFQRSKGDGHGGRAPQGLHERLILLHIAGQAGGEAGERLALRLVGGKDLHRLEQGDFHGFFIYDDVAVPVQHRGLGVRVQPHLLDLLFQRRGGDDGQALLALFHMPPELLPLVEASGGHGGVGPLHVNQDGVIDGIAVEPGHGAEVVKIPLTLEQVLDILFNA